MIYVIPEWSSGVPYFLRFQSEFGNKEFIIWATVSSWSCFCWLYRVSPSLAAKNIISLISVLTIWWCPWPAKSSTKNLCLISCTPPLPKSHICCPSPCLFGAVSQSYLKCCFPGCSPHFPQTKLNLQLWHCEFFLSQQRYMPKGRFISTSLPDLHP